LPTAGAKSRCPVGGSSKTTASGSRNRRGQPREKT
jgi:hypothetical protein